MPSPAARRALLRYHPHSRRNPYQEMLYGLCTAAGIVPWRLPNIARLNDTPSDGVEVVLHVHWTQMVLSGALSRTEAETRLGSLTATLDRFAADGGRLIWTVHNVLPHEARFPELEAKVCQAIADRAAAVHVMCDRTVEAAAPWYELPQDRLTVIPHSSYLGVYPNFILRAEARARLGLEPHHTVLTAFGGLRRYKGLNRLLDAFESASSTAPDLRLVIAGKPIMVDGLDSFRARCDRNAAVVAHLGVVPPRAVQLYINAADAVLLPHTSALNSGLVGLAYSFGRPVIAPDAGCVAAQVPPECGVLFAPDDRQSLERAMGQAAALRDPRFGTAALERARSYPPEAMAADFVALVERVLAEDG